ncbi:hypothetical protein I6I99_18980 [Sphingobacterium multivorum]|uniref:Uncharacterized protein n=1 Tax=Sphingobacterium multivorum TaxID=28454 RepID=A0ABX7CTJ2_SPHMU|nr:hypothetical protein [Sphingobacterium multivorum]QQT29415.1 hypothetical protein I6I99_18980 [Sphingobacterium multivorum]QQT54560.1 hypothetical protein I6I98_04695 [Sphingobacterium multivorum]
MLDRRKVQPARGPIINYRYNEMEILKEQEFNGLDQVLAEQTMLAWTALLPFISNDEDDADSCPILAF